MTLRRRHLLLASATFPLAPVRAAKAGGRPVGLAIESHVPPLHPTLGGQALALAERIAVIAGCRVALLGPGEQAPPGVPRARHGALAFAAPPFAGAELLGGFPFGMTPEELPAWSATPEARRLWHEGFAGAGLHAVPCGIAVGFGPTWWPVEPTEAAPGEGVLRIRPGLAARAWELAGARTAPAGRRGAPAACDAVDETIGWASPLGCAAGERAGYRVPFAFGHAIELVMETEMFDALPAALRGALGSACAEEAERAAAAIAAPVAVPPELRRPLPHPVSEALAEAMGEALREAATRAAASAPAAVHRAFTAYAEARRGGIPALA